MLLENEYLIEYEWQKNDNRFIIIYATNQQEARKILQKYKIFSIKLKTTEYARYKNNKN